jgi:hypothetical protein
MVRSLGLLVLAVALGLTSLSVGPVANAQVVQQSPPIEWVQVPGLYPFPILTEQLYVEFGQLSAPIDPDKVGVYQVPGNLIIAGHVDWAGRTRPFYGLKDLREGDRVELSDGRVYQVSWVSTIDAAPEGADADEVFDPKADVLTLITCGGPFSQSRHEYLERVVVRAARVPATTTE